MKFNELDERSKVEILKLSQKFPFSVDECIPYYLMGANHTEKLLELKTAGFGDYIIEIVNQGMYNA